MKSMKKRVMGAVLAVVMCITAIGYTPITAKASSDSAASYQLESAETISLDKGYTYDFGEEETDYKCVKLTVPKRGVLSMSTTYDYYEGVYASVFNSNKENIYCIKVESGENKIGLNKGTYYVVFQPHYSGTGKFSCKFNFTACDNWEIENDDTKGKATTGIKLNKKYYGSLGSNLLSVSDRLKDEYDFYKVKLKKNELYRLEATGPSTRTVIVRIYDNKSEAGDLFDVAKNGLNESDGQVFGVPKTGYYYVCAFNEYDYTEYSFCLKKVKFNTAISKIKAKSNSIQLKWKKVNTFLSKKYYSTNIGKTGYQIQYSTNKKFKSAKKITITNKSKSKQTLSKTIKKLKHNKKYYVRVRSFAKYEVNNNKKFETAYSEWSKTKTIRTK